MKFHLEIELTEEQAADPWKIEDDIRSVAYSINQFEYEGTFRGVKWFLDPAPSSVVCAECGSSDITDNTIDGVVYDWCRQCSTEVDVVHS